MIQPKEASHYNTYLIVYVFSPRSSIWRRMIEKRAFFTNLTLTN
jgi:hypothetical protein